jgi:capsular polysaccharide transport system permease protein
MKDKLEKLKGAVARRLEMRNGHTPAESEAPGGLVHRNLQKDVRASALSFSGYRWVLVITALAAFYYGFIASDRYVTEAQLYVKSTNNGAPTVPQLSLITGVGDGTRDGLVLQEYIRSRDMLRHLEASVGLSAHYSDRAWDMVARMQQTPTQEEFLDYYRSMVDLSIDPESAVLTVSVQAFTPEYSQRLLEEILAEADRFINGVNQRIAAEEIEFVQKELDRARTHVNGARDRMLAFQNENELLDPEVSGAAMQQVVNELEAQLVSLQTEYKVLKSYLNEEAPQVVSLKDRIDSVRAQLQEERGKISSDELQSINEINARFQELELEFQFASDLYKATLEGLEQARVESYHKLKHLVVLQSPALADEALEPNKIYNLVTLFVLLSLAYGIITMISATIREHRDV